MLIDQKHNELITALKKMQSYATLVEVHLEEKGNNSCTIFKSRSYHITSGLPTLSKTLARQLKYHETLII